jgi:hypothetical protein
MPYKVVKVSGGFKVSHAGKTFSRKPQSLGKARSQMRALYAHEGGYGNPNQNDGHPSGIRRQASR